MKFTFTVLLIAATLLLHGWSRGSAAATSVAAPDVGSLHGDFGAPQGDPFHAVLTSQ